MPPSMGNLRWARFPSGRKRRRVAYRGRSGRRRGAAARRRKRPQQSSSTRPLSYPLNIRFVPALRRCQPWPPCTSAPTPRSRPSASRRPDRLHRPPPGLLAQPRPEPVPGARHRRHLGRGDRGRRLRRRHLGTLPLRLVQPRGGPAGSHRLQRVPAGQFLGSTASARTGTAAATSSSPSAGCPAPPRAACWRCCSPCSAARSTAATWPRP